MVINSGTRRKKMIKRVLLAAMLLVGVAAVAQSYLPGISFPHCSGWAENTGGACGASCFSTWVPTGGIVYLPTITGSNDSSAPNGVQTTCTTAAGASAGPWMKLTTPAKGQGPLDVYTQVTVTFPVRNVNYDIYILTQSFWSGGDIPVIWSSFSGTSFLPVISYPTNQSTSSAYCDYGSQLYDCQPLTSANSNAPQWVVFRGNPGSNSSLNLLIGLADAADFPSAGGSVALGEVMVAPSSVSGSKPFGSYCNAFSGSGTLVSSTSQATTNSWTAVTACQNSSSQPYLDLTNGQVHAATGCVNGGVDCYGIKVAVKP
jgi:hypothetical protein